MKNILKILSLKFTSNICTRMALSVSASACHWSAYQPEEPECLRDIKNN
ncbi:MAG: cyclic lactone autoinducer peptide [Clostridium beijerinckii]|nr:cyclic lactone autoinducer peptide [Clostridium beijerinckii]